MAILKTAVILFNLGGPDSKESVEPFLFNFFTDPNIIRVPFFIRRPLARMIARKRTRNEAGSAYAELGWKSPLLENSQAQARALEKELGDGHRAVVCMRYWHPMADEIVSAVKEYTPDKIILLPLYPQFSTTTTRSALEVWSRAAKHANLSVATELVCCYPFDDGFISASAALVKRACETAERETGKRPRVLFSAHGLPEKVIADGDPYQWQCEEGARKMAAAANLSDWIVCYQSRVGPLKWIGPSTGDEIARAGRDGVPVVIYPHAFTQEHVETLVEIEQEYRHLASSCGVPYFARVETVGTHPDFIAGLARLVRNGESARVCPETFRRCCRNKTKRMAA